MGGGGGLMIGILRYSEAAPVPLPLLHCCLFIILNLKMDKCKLLNM